MRNDKMQHLRVEHIIHVEHHLGEQPVIRLIEGCVNKILAHIRLDSKRQKVPRLGMNVKIGLDSSTVPLRFERSLGVLELRSVIDVE